MVCGLCEAQRRDTYRYCRGAIDPEQSAAAEALLRKGAVEQVYADGGRTVFSLRTNIAEGHYALVLVSGDDYRPRCLDGFGEWRIMENEDGFVRWEGGMAGRGYVELHGLGNGFYLEKAYLPT